MIKNLALIPARKNSKGIKNKNRILFDNTANFIKKLKFIDKSIVSSDDDIILKKSVKYSFTNHHRKSSFAKDNTSIKKTITNICNEMKLDKNDIIWLFYLPIVNRVKKDFENAFKLTKKITLKVFAHLLKLIISIILLLLKFKIIYQSSLKIMFLEDKIYHLLTSIFIIFVVLKLVS